MIPGYDKFFNFHQVSFNYAKSLSNPWYASHNEAQAFSPTMIPAVDQGGLLCRPPQLATKKRNGNCRAPLSTEEARIAVGS